MPQTMAFLSQPRLNESLKSFSFSSGIQYTTSLCIHAASAEVIEQPETTPFHCGAVRQTMLLIG